MNVALALADEMQAAGLGVVGETIFVGRIPAEPIKSGMWSVVAVGGSTEGGNISRWKARSQFTVTLIHKSASTIYDFDTTVRLALITLPYSDARFLDVQVGPLQDQDIAESENRVGVWGVETVTINGMEVPEGES